MMKPKYHWTSTHLSFRGAPRERLLLGLKSMVDGIGWRVFRLPDFMEPFFVTC
jgi:hypothetical protein